jgi:hypothetical protein
MQNCHVLSRPVSELTENQGFCCCESIAEIQSIEFDERPNLRLESDREAEAQSQTSGIADLSFPVFMLQVPTPN